MNKIQILHIDEVSKKLKDQLYELCFPKNEGYMKMYLDFCWRASHEYKKEDFECWIVYQTIDDKIVGWGIIQDLFYGWSRTDFELNIYVPKKYRGNGIGKNILKYVEKGFPNTTFTVWASSTENKLLFKHVSDNELFHIYDYNHYDKTEELKRIKI